MTSRTKEQSKSQNRGVHFSYLSVVALALPASTFVGYVFPESTIVFGQSAAIVVFASLTLFAIILWALTDSRTERSVSLTVFLLLMFLGWAWFAFLAWHHNYGSAYTMWAFPAILIMLFLKPPDSKMCFGAIDVLIASFIAISVTAHILHVTNIYTFEYFFYPNRLPTFIQESGIPKMLGFEYRWPGPFASVSDAGPVGGIIFMLGWLRTGFFRWLAFIGGGIILLAAYSFNGIYAVAGGILAIFLMCRSPICTRITKWGRIAITLVLTFLGVIFIIASDPTFNGRTDIWSDYLSIWNEFPMFGSGPHYIENHPEMFTVGHAHNFYIDTLVKHGWIAFAFVITTFILGGVIAFKARKLGATSLFGLWTSLILLLVAETLIAWRYLGLFMFAFLLIALIENSLISESRSPKPLHLQDLNHGS